MPPAVDVVLVVEGPVVVGPEVVLAPVVVPLVLLVVPVPVVPVAADVLPDPPAPPAPDPDPVLGRPLPSSEPIAHEKSVSPAANSNANNDADKDVFRLMMVGLREERRSHFPRPRMAARTHADEKKWRDPADTSLEV
jgi:hypothetical protein